MTVKEHLEKIAEKTRKASSMVGEGLADACEVVKESAKAAAVTIFDQDGDGQLTKEDIRILSKKGAETGKKVVQRTVEIVEEASKTDLVKEAAAGALVGAAVAVPVPLIGPVAGSAIGASIGVYAKVTREKPGPSKNTAKAVANTAKIVATTVKATRDLVSPTAKKK